METMDNNHREYAPKNSPEILDMCRNNPSTREHGLHRFNEISNGQERSHNTQRFFFH
jgi:hypothetical protein